MEMRNMRKYILLGLFLLVSMTTQLAAQDKKAAPAAPKTKQPLAYEAFFKQGMRKIGEVLPIYTNDKQYYLEISRENLDRDLLVSGIIVNGPWSGESSTITDRICFTLSNDDKQLNVMQEVWDARIDSTKSDAGLVEAFKASNMPSVKWSMPIYAYGKDKGSYIVDITKDVTSAGKLFAFPNLQWVNRPVATRFSIDTIQVLNEGVKFLVIHSQTDRIKGGMGMPGQDKSSTVRIEWAIQRLPESHMAMRKADPRVGYNAITYADYSEDPLQVKNKSIIRRWKLEVKPEDWAKYESGELVEPKEPILIYLDKTIAGGYRNAAKIAVKEWNKAFAAAGFKNVLQVQEGQAPVMWGYHTITCTFLECLPRTNTVSNPYTGEIIGANMVVSILELRKNLPIAQSLLEAYEPKVYSDLENMVRHQIFRRQFAFQIGNVLGLLPNDASRYAYTPAQLRDKEWVKANGISSSMMDCALVNFLAQPGDGIAFEDLFGHVSHYDRWALEFGYRVYPEGKEKDGVRNLLMQAKDNRYLAYAPKAKNDLVPYDLSSNIVEAVQLGMKNINVAVPQIEALSAELDKENSWFTYNKLMGGQLSLYNAFMGALRSRIGMVQLKPTIKGYNDNTWTFMPRGDQKAAADYLLKTVYSGVPAWMQHTRLRGLSGNSGEQTMTVTMLQTSGALTNPNLLNRLFATEQEQPGKAYTAAELYHAIDKAVFADFSTTAKIDRFKTRAQYLYMEAFVKNYVATDVVKNMGQPVANFMVSQMKKTLASIERLGKTHATAAGKAHYRGLYLYAKHLLSNEEQKIKERAASKKAAPAKALTPVQYTGNCNATWL